MQLKHGLVLLLGCALAAGGACADQEGGSSALDSAADGGHTSDGTHALPAEAVVGELNADELMDFCGPVASLLSVFEDIDTNLTLLCTERGLIARFSSEDGDVATCEEVRDTCLEKAEEEGAADSEAPAPIDCVTEQGLVACDVTIADFDTCRIAADLMMALALETVACDISEEKALEMLAIKTQGYPGECEPLAERCPFLIGLEPATE